MTENKTKICTKCKQEKYKTEFHKNKNNKDKLEYRCKECCKKKRRKYYLKNKDKEKKASKLYNMNHKEERRIKRKIYIQSEKGKATTKKYNEKNKEEIRLKKIIYRNSDRGREVAKKYEESDKCKKANIKKNKNYRKKYPNRRKAQSILQSTIKSGKIIRPKVCEVCGRINCKIAGHHEDYSKPLDVIFCCRRCHDILDEQRRQKEKLEKDLTK